MHESLSATSTIHAPSSAVFAMLADPAFHAALDGTGRVRRSLARPITRAGEVLRLVMHDENHPDGVDELCNEVLVFDPPYEILWRAGHVGPSGRIERSGWVWGFELSEIGPSETVVTHRSWSAVGTGPRTHTPFRPSSAEDLAIALRHLAGLVEGAAVLFVE